MIIICVENRTDAKPKTDPDKHYTWKCPGCGQVTHGDSRVDSLFEIRHDPLCCYCRVKRGELCINGSAFVRVPDWKERVTA